MAENNFFCRYVCRLGPALKYAVLKFLVRLGSFIHLVVANNNYFTCRFGFCVSLSKLNVLFYSRICLICVAQELSDILDLGPIFLFNCNSYFVDSVVA